MVVVCSIRLWGKTDVDEGKGGSEVRGENYDKQITGSRAEYTKVELLTANKNSNIFSLLLSLFCLFTDMNGGELGELHLR